MPSIESDVYHALAHPLRLGVLKLLARKGELNVSSLLVKFPDYTQSSLSQHLTVLRNCGLVTTRKASQRVFYSVNRSRITEIRASLEGLTQAVV